MTPGAETISVIGAGAVAAGIAQVASSAGLRVVLCEVNPHSLEFETESLREAADADIVIEAIAEDISAKQSLFRKLEEVCGSETVFASSTSSLSITEIASVLDRPGRLLGLHFLEPVESARLVEVVSGHATERETARDVGHMLTGWGKHCVHARSMPGYIFERVSRPFCSEALRLLHEQIVDPETLDIIMRESGGFETGPLEIMNLVGHDVGYMKNQAVFDARYLDPRFKPSLIQRELVDAGFPGKNDHGGFFDCPVDPCRRSPEALFPKTHPDRIVIRGGLGVASSLKALFSGAGIAVEQCSGDGFIEFDDGRLAMTDGRTATERASAENCDNLVLFDLALDYTTSGRIVITGADQCGQTMLERAAGLFRSIGKSVTVIRDGPGMVVMRIVCMLANEGADTVNQGVCDVSAVDRAMRHGARYPMGPLVWADRIGLDYVARTLNNIRNSFGESRYRVSPLLRRKSLAGRDFYG